MSQPPPHQPELTLAEEALVVGCGFDVGYFNKKDIERWADSKIVEIETPPDELLNLSMIRETQPEDVSKLLKSLCSKGNDISNAEIQFGFLGLCFENAKISLEAAVRALFRLNLESTLSSEVERFIYWLDDAYDLAVSGINCSLEEVDGELRKFVRPFTQKMRTRYSELLPENDRE